MRAELSILLVTFAQLWAVAMAQEQPAAVISPSSVGSAIYITHVTVIDTDTGKEAQDRTVVISGERISDVGDSKRLRVPAGAKVVNGTGKYLIPGLWDMHVHGTIFDATLPLYIANGVTGVREMFGPPDANKFRAELAAKKNYSHGSDGRKDGKDCCDDSGRCGNKCGNFHGDAVVLPNRFDFGMSYA